MKGNKGGRKRWWVRRELIKATVVEVMVEEEGGRGEERKKEKRKRVRFDYIDYFSNDLYLQARKGKKKNKERNEMK